MSDGMRDSEKWGFMGAPHARRPKVTLERLDAVVRDQVGLNAAGPVTDERPLEDMRFDSLDLIELTMDIEKELDTRIPDAGIPKGSDTIPDAVGRIWRSLYSNYHAKTEDTK